MSEKASATKVIIHHKMVGMPVFDDEFACNGDLELNGVAQRIIRNHGDTISRGFRMWLHRVEPGLLVRNLDQTVYDAFLLEHKLSISALSKDNAVPQHHVTVYYDFDPPETSSPLLKLQVGVDRPNDRNKDHPM